MNPKLYPQSKHGVLSIQPDGQIDSCNGLAEELLGYSPVGKNIREIDPGQLLEFHSIEMNGFSLAIFHTKKQAQIILDSLANAHYQREPAEVYCELLNGAIEATGSGNGVLFAADVSTPPPPNHSYIAPFIQEAMEKQTPIITSYFEPTEYQKPSPHYFLGMPILHNGTAIGALGLTHPTTPYKEEQLSLLLPILQFALLLIRDTGLKTARDKALAQKNAMSNFLANMSHEIRTPLNIIMGMTELLLYTDLTQKQEAYAAKSYRAAEGLLELINDILDLSKIEAGQLEFESIPFNLKQEVRDLTDLFQIKATQKGINLHTSYTAPSKFTGDPTRIRQVLTNLLSNATKFTEEGSITLKIFPEENHLRFEVIDTGPGLPPGSLETIFNKFIQGDFSTTRKYGGSGLGLAICKEMVEGMGGTIGYTKNPTGSTFWFTL